MAEKHALTETEAQAIIEAVLGAGDAPVMGTKVLQPGDIALILRDGGGCEIVSCMTPDLKNAAGKPLDMGGIAIRGSVALSLFKIAHDVPLMTKVLNLVTQEFAESPPTKRLDS